MSKIVAIDFEAANERSGSAISIGYAVIEENLITDYNSYLIKPYDEYSKFLPHSIKIHHITPDMVKDQPNFKDLYYNKLQDILKDCILVAHGAHWDIRVLKSLFYLYNIPYIPFKYFCTVDLSNSLWPNLSNHKLPTVSEALNFTLKDHHKAKYDAFACARIVTGAMKDLDTHDPLSICFMSNIKIGKILNLKKEGWNSLKYYRPNLNHLFKMTNSSYYNHIYYNKNIAKIGDFSELSKEYIAQHLTNIDANFHEYILNDTDIVVLSDRYFNVNRRPKFINTLISIAEMKNKPIISETEFKENLFSYNYLDNKTGYPKYNKNEYI